MLDLWGRSLIYIWLMLLSLHSYYFHNLGVALFPLAGMVLSFVFLVFLSVLHPSRLLASLSLSFFPIIIVSIFLLLGLVSAFFVEPSLGFSRFLALFLFVALVINFSYFRIYRIPSLLFALKLCLITHLCFFWFQVSAHYLGFGFYDFLEPVTGEAQRVFGGNYTVPFINQRLIRASGLYSEPGTFATFIFFMYLIYKSLSCSCRKVDRVVFGWFDIFVVASVLFSFSVFGFIFSFMYGAFFLFSSLKRFLAIFPVLVCFSFLIFNVYIYPRFFGDVSTDTGMGFRLDGILTYFERISQVQPLLWFGSGFFSDYSIYSPFIVWNDLGLFFSLIMIFGVIGFFCFFVVFCCCLGGFRLYDFLLLFFVLLSKISVSMALFWMVVSTLFGKKIAMVYWTR
ncbi:hypothetical protein KXR94_11525 [Stutzerimonas stutzeri]